MTGPNAEADCPEDDSGRGCFPLRVLTRKVGDSVAAQREQAEKEGQFFNETKRCRIASEAAQAAAEETRDFAKSVVKAVNAPINDLLLAYQQRLSGSPLVSDSDPPIGLDPAQDDPLGDFPMSEVTRTDILSPSNTIRRIRKAEKEKRAAEAARIKLETEKLLAERRAAETKEEAERIAAELAEAKEVSDRRYKLWLAILGTIAALATAGAGALALASKALH